MKLQYRVKNGQVEIVRCFGADTKVTLPAQVAGYPVCRVAAYAFSARKSKEDTDVFEYDTEDGLFKDGQHLLAGNEIESVVFPDSVEQIGNYIFYGCKSLQELEFSDALTQIGSGAFTGCGQITHLQVHLRRGKKTCVKEILGDLWQRIDVTFVYEKERQAVNLVFPEHYEEAVENTPARILFTQHHGTGNNYRQCFYNREMDYRKYDELFPLAVAQDKTEVLADLVFNRLESPMELTESHKEVYESYVRGHLPEVAGYLVKQEQVDRLELISGHGLWDEAGIDAAIRAASELGKVEALSFLMNEKHLLFPEKKRKRFEL